MNYSIAPPGPGPLYTPWQRVGAALAYNNGGIMLPEDVPTGNRGVGSLNVSVLYIRGQRVVGGSRLVTAAGDTTMGGFDYEVIINKTVAAANAVILAANAPLGVMNRVSDGKGDANVNNITISAPAGGMINGVVAPAVLNAAWGSILFRSFGGNNWSILP